MGLWAASNAHTRSLVVGLRLRVQQHPGAAATAGIRAVSTFYTVKAGPAVARVPLLNSPAYVGASTDRCMRPYNEDRFYAGVLDLPRLDAEGTRPVFNFGVFDGHDGSSAAEFLKDNLANYVERADLESGQRLAKTYQEQYGGYWRAWRSTVGRYDRKLQASRFDDLALRLPLAFLQADLDYLATHDRGGSTCTDVFIYPLDPKKPFWEPKSASNMTVAQVGDSRAILADNQGNALALTTVHHASHPHESDRLADFHQGFILEPDGTERFFHYANTRAFGDVDGKSRGVSAEPDLTTIDLGPGRGKLPGEEAFVLLITDGVTDKAGDQELVDLVIQSATSWGSKRGTPARAADEVVRYVENLGTADNATAMVIRLGGWGSWDGWTDRSGQIRADRMLAGELKRQ